VGRPMRGGEDHRGPQVTGLSIGSALLGPRQRLTKLCADQTIGPRSPAVRTAVSANRENRHDHGGLFLGGDPQTSVRTNISEPPSSIRQLVNEANGYQRYAVLSRAPLSTLPSEYGGQKTSKTKLRALHLVEFRTETTLPFLMASLRKTLFDIPPKAAPCLCRSATPDTGTQNVNRHIFRPRTTLN
jgi:hypothetical protein